MALEIIGAGFGRTGTDSMKLALERLGFGPCYHMKEVLPDPAKIALWRRAAQGRLPDWDTAFAGYRSTVDWPGAYYWRELSGHFPEARILLTVRDPADWYASMDKTIFEVLRSSTDQESIGLKLVGEGVFGGKIDDPDHAIAVFEKNIADVQAAFGDERLLTYNLGDGWEPLCRFLNCPVPDEPFPHSNRQKEFGKLIKRHMTLDER